MAIAIDYQIGDVVFVAYPFPDSLFFNAQTRTVREVRVLDTGDDALVKFETGNDVQDSNAAQTVFTTVELASTAIIDDILTKADATANVDPTLSVVSTAGQATLSLGRINT